MKYSIIIAVFNRIDEVKELLSSAEKLKFNRSEFELLFVDDGSKDGFKEFIKNYTSASHLQIKTVYQKNKGPGAARNYGMQVSQSQYLIFVDSDCIFPKQWLAEIDKSIKKNNWDAFGGPDTCHPSFSPMLKAINYSMTSIIGTGGTRGNKKSIGRFYPRSFNMGIRRKIFEQIGGMGGLRHGQDMDFSQRIYDAGFTVGLIPEAFIYHKRRTSFSKFFRQIFNWGVARINLGMKHPSLLKLVHFLPLLVLLWIVCIFSIILIYYPAGLLLLIITIISYLCICFWSIIESFSKYKSLKAALLSPITLNIQVFAYGLGLLKALWQIKVIRKKEATGFIKGYYGKNK